MAGSLGPIRTPVNAPGRSVGSADEAVGHETTMPEPPMQPTVLGLRPSFGFGDRLGLATPGHLDAVRGTRFQPVLAQQSIREMERTGRQPEDVIAAVRWGLEQTDWTGPWGADADHLKTRADVERTAAAGFTMFTIDPSAQVDQQADRYGPDELIAAVRATLAAGVFNGLEELHDVYLGRVVEVSESLQFCFSNVETLHRTAVKYGRAMQHAQRMAGWIQSACAGRRYEIEISVDETDSPTTPLEHLFCALELWRRGVRVVSLAPRFVGDFEKGVDYRGNLRAFESHLLQHAAIARHCGPYKLSVHSGSDKFAVYPVLGRVCGDLLHVKTAGTSWLEALRVVARCDPALFAEIANYARERYPTDRASYHVSADPLRLPRSFSLRPAEIEACWLDQDDGRQLLHVTFGSILTLGATTDGRTFRAAILDLLRRQPDLHREVLATHLRRHLDRLDAG